MLYGVVESKGEACPDTEGKNPPAVVDITETMPVVVPGFPCVSN